MKGISTIFWDVWYITFMYQSDVKYNMYSDVYFSLQAKNKRHARKVLFKFLNKKYKRRICNIRIADYPFLPMNKAEEFDYSAKYFWSEQSRLG